MNSFWYLDRSVAHRVKISSIVLFLRRASCEVGPVVDAPRFAAAPGAFCAAALSDDWAPPRVELVAGAVEVGAAEVVAAGAAGAPPKRLPAGLGAAEGAAVLAGAAAEETGAFEPKRLLAGFGASEVGLELGGLFMPPKSELACAGAAGALLAGVEDGAPAAAPNGDGVAADVVGVLLLAPPRVKPNGLAAAGSEVLPPKSDGFAAAGSPVFGAPNNPAEGVDEPDCPLGACPKRLPDGAVGFDVKSELGAAPDAAG